MQSNSKVTIADRAVDRDLLLTYADLAYFGEYATVSTVGSARALEANKGRNDIHKEILESVGLEYPEGELEFNKALETFVEKHKPRFSD
jgi:hypothetical protein